MIDTVIITQHGRSPAMPLEVALEKALEVSSRLSKKVIVKNVKTLEVVATFYRGAAK